MKKAVFGLATAAVLTVAGAMPLLTTTQPAEAGPGWGQNRVPFCVDPVYFEDFKPFTINIAEPAVPFLEAWGVGHAGECVE